MCYFVSMVIIEVDFAVIQLNKDILESDTLCSRFRKPFSFRLYKTVLL